MSASDGKSDDFASFIASALVPFPGCTDAVLTQLGGKAYSLVRLAAKGYQVPPGVVLTTAFFAPWIDQMRCGPEWHAISQAPEAQWPVLCKSLQQLALALPLSAAQAAAIHVMNQQLATLTPSTLFAVRSSSPQEDRMDASFAGGYETILGITLPHCLAAIRQCFASMFDQRVLAYKALKHLATAEPRMAVVVQAQIHSEVAGVAFSINPLNNDYDQAVIDANWGQGETVVAGLVNPDHWVIDKRDGTFIEAAIGKKQLSRYLLTDGTRVERSDRNNEACLSIDQLAEIMALVIRIEAEMQLPVDIEWAIANEQLFVLQARPVTAFVPLPRSMRTAPGQRRRLYMDLALSSGFTINAPISTLGLDVFRTVFGDFAQHAFGPTDLKSKPGDEMLIFAGGRMYLDLSNTMWLASPRLLAKKMAFADSLLARALHNIDRRLYQAEQRPSWAGWRLMARVPGAWWRLRKMIGTLVLPFLAPLRMQRRLLKQLDAFERTLSSDVDFNLPLQSFFDTHVRAHLGTLLNVSTPAVGPGVLAVKAFAQLARPLIRRDEDLADRLDRGFEGNVVVAMSIHMHRLAKLLPKGQARDIAQLATAVKCGELSAQFMASWYEFLERFGCRGPMEMDLAHPRYADAPEIALQQIRAMSQGDLNTDPALSAAQQITRRRDAVATILGRAGPIRRAILTHLNVVIEGYSGLRDTPKYHLLLLLQRLRKRLVLEGEHLCAQGRLDQASQVFDIPMAVLIQAEHDPALDLRQLSLKEREWTQHLASQVINFPPLIDSRGRIHHAPRGPHRAGEFAGVGLSGGLVSGPARTLRSPHDQIRKGEVLIAYTTDPGWTPIFANAAAVVLEIGGALQHGAVVARELGLPCVAGIEGITSAIKDGQMIEVDGSAGVVRILG